MLKSFLDRILEIQRTESILVEDVWYSTKPLHYIEPEKKIPNPNPVTVSTLTGFAEYITENIDGLMLSECFILVDGHANVRMESQFIGHFKQRFNYINAQCFENPFKFGIFHDFEQFIIALQSNFVPNDQLKDLLSTVGNVVQSKVETSEDDGISQSVIAKKGISLKGKEKIPNPVSLKPYRTFLEIEQPESRFVVRAQDGPRIALIEADGGMWKLEAMSRIKAWLRDNLPEGMTIIA